MPAGVARRRLIRLLKRKFWTPCLILVKIIRSPLQSKARVPATSPLICKRKNSGASPSLRLLSRDALLSSRGQCTDHDRCANQHEDQGHNAPNNEKSVCCIRIGIEKASFAMQYEFCIKYQKTPTKKRSDHYAHNGACDDLNDLHLMGKNRMILAAFKSDQMPLMTMFHRARNPLPKPVIFWPFQRSICPPEPCPMASPSRCQ